MFTKQFKTFMQMVGLTASVNEFPVNMKSTTGTIVSVRPVYNTGFPYASYTSLCTGPQNSQGIALGSSTTTPTEDDYCMNTYYTSSDIGYTVSSSVYLDDESNLNLKHLLTITNKKNESITIAEIGYQQILSSSDNSKRWFLLDHTVLDDPVTIAPNESAVIEYILKSIMS